MNWLRSWLPEGKEQKTQRMHAAQRQDAALTLEEMHQQAQTMKLQRMQRMQESESLLDEAKRLNKQGRKAEARSCLERRNAIDVLIRQITGQLRNLEQQIVTVQGAATTLEAAATMQKGNAIMGDLVKQADIEDFDYIAADMETLTMESRELGDSLAMRMTAGLDVEVDEEIDGMLSQWDDEAVADLPSTNSSTVTVGTPINVQKQNSNVQLPGGYVNAQQNLELEN